MADSLPGLGIVAAVLGVVITMGALVDLRRNRHKVRRRCRHVSRNPSLLRLSRPVCRQYGQNRRRRTRLLLRPARSHDFIHEGSPPIRAVESRVAPFLGIAAQL